MAPDFAGKAALITGGGRGIGRAIALGLADAGASLILIARSTRQLAETRAMLTARGAAAGRVRILPADLGDEEQRTRAAAAALGPGRVDILIVMGKKTEEVPVYLPGTTAHVISGLRWSGRSCQTAVDRVVSAAATVSQKARK